MTTKPNIQATTRELKNQSQALLKRIKAMQEGVHKTLAEVRSKEGELIDKDKLERARLKAISDESAAQNRITAYVMPDDVQDVQQTHPSSDGAASGSARAAGSAQQGHAERTSTPRQQGERPQGQHTAPRQGDRPFTPRPQGQGAPYGQRPQGQGAPYGQQRPQGQGAPYGQQRPQGQGAPYGQRPQGQGAPYGQRPQGQGAPYGQRPQGQGAPYGQRPQGQGAPYGQRPQGQGAPYGQRQGGGFGDKDGDSKGFAPRPQARAAKPAGGIDKPMGLKKPSKDVTPVANKATTFTKPYEDKRIKNKKSAVKEAPPSLKLEEERMGSRKIKNKARQMPKKLEPIKIEHIEITHDYVTVKDLSEKIGKPASEIIKKLFVLGNMATINQEIDYDTIELICSEYNITVQNNIAKTAEEVMQEVADVVDTDANLIERPPVVTIMGHVDHGKTSLLDAIRKTQVTAGEAGGITQHIGAYTVNQDGRIITFLDTPGHEAFTSMRARGAQATDIAVLVVAADDGIMPQTVEAINHAKAANVPIIVAINKMDKPDANPDKILQQLTEHNLLVEEWGGEVIAVQVSAKTGINLDKLLEMITLVADVQELKANPNRLAKGIIIEAQLDKGRGPVATVLMQNGTLRIGDTIVAGTAYGRVRAMINDKGERVTQVGPGYPVSVLGFNEVPDAGDILNGVDGDKFSRSIAEERKDKVKAARVQSVGKVSLDDLFEQIAQGNVKDLNLIIKADVQGSVEAVRQSMEKLSNEEVRVRSIHGGVGAITEKDVMLASASNAIIIGFNVRPDLKAREAAERESIDMRLYRVIYNAIEDMEKAMKGLLAPQYKENMLGRCEVRDVFKVTGVGTIAGSYVLEGKMQRNAQIRVVRDGIVVHEGKISSLKRFKDDAKEVAHGYECGVGLENYNDVKEGDIYECFVMEEIER